VTTPAPFVQLRGICKSFPGVLANDRVDFAVAAGEIHALLGENGAGKSTLMGILSGRYQPDAGEILLDGRPVSFGSPGDAISHGIGMVHQHFRLVESFTVVENLAIGLHGASWLLDAQVIATQVEQLAARYGLRVHPRARVGALSVGERQRVEILRALFRGARVLILDEPTAVLTPQETRALFATLRQLAAQGAGIVFISHKLGEVLAIADRITVLRAGRVVAQARPVETTQAELARAMVGRELGGPPPRQRTPPGPPRLVVEGLRARHDAGYEALRGIDLEVRAGEVLGLAGVAGNGQRELAETLAGLRPATAGRVRLDGRDLTNRSPRAIHAAGLAYVPEDRLETGLGPDLAVADNLIVRDYHRPPLARGPFLDRRAVTERAARIIRAFDVRGARPWLPVRALSGGNAQKLLLARELERRPLALVAAQPTRGLDVAATEAVHRLLLEQRQAGTAILLISEDLDELLALSDRLAVIYEGRIIGVLDNEALDPDTIGLLMAGAGAA
jgi:ABC-type uncharacterized transport system ATPase subunit